MPVTWAKRGNVKTQEIRESFLQYFKGKKHTIVPSSSLIPAGDPTLLFVNAGMVQFKDCFLGTDKRSYERATTCQKCLRITGKHNDLENVGRTARHHTFFEMLGNFSFGDYFKKEAIIFAWEYLTVILKLPKERLWITVYEEDNDAAELWRTLTDVAPERILRCGKEDNFWAMGESGPCGPCSEVHYYLGEKPLEQNEAAFRGGEGFLEIWNLVFMQYNRDPSGALSALPRPSVDTGMGLERIAAVKQGVFANYDSDEIRQLIAVCEKLSGKKYDGRDYTERDIEKDTTYAKDVAMRVIADHLRACSFLLADGVNPGSDGRGYVLRRLVRRAARHGRTLGFHEPVLYRVAEEVVRIYGAAYAELQENAACISKTIRSEEEKFLQTLDAGLGMLEKEISAAREKGLHIISGKLAFTLHDTYGFPLDLTADITRSRGLGVDNEEFNREMEAQQERSRAVRFSDSTLLLQKMVKALPTAFVGYDYDEYESEILGLFGEQGELNEASEGQEVAVVTRETPFYAESGGQVGDTGRISSNNGVLDVLDTQKGAGDTIIHLCRVLEGNFKQGDHVRQVIDSVRRRAIRAHHTATHLLHLALREVLGEHATQAGSRVSEAGFRFDFNHFEALSAEQLAQIEILANKRIQENYPVETQVLPLEEAKHSGAVALFGEKYGESVRVIQVGPHSREFCGGTHARRSGDLGLLLILNESSIAAGVRRIEGCAASAALEQLMSQRKTLQHAAKILQSAENEVPDRLTRLIEQNREHEEKLAQFGERMLVEQGADLANKAATLQSGIKLLASRVENVNSKQLRELADDLRSRLGASCIALAGVSEGKVIMLTAVSDDLTSRYHAGKLIAEMGQVIGCRGGGKPSLAQAGGGDPSKLEQALKRFEELVRCQ